MQDGLSTEQEDRLVWAPDLFGSAAFLVSGVLAYRVATGRRPGRRDREWRMAAVNLAGCVLFGISAIASYIVPSSGSILDLAAANWTTALGALCFFGSAAPDACCRARSPVPKELDHAVTMTRRPDLSDEQTRRSSPQGVTATASCSSRRPTTSSPSTGCRAVDAMRLIGEELVLDGIPMRNLATFVTTWMEPEAQRIIAENLHRNFIDHAEYPQTAEIEQRCIRMLADLFHAPGETTGARTQGSSEAIMLGALSLKWKWRERREKAGKDTHRPNLVFGGDVHVVWEKFCRYFDVEPRIIPLQPDKYTIGPGGRGAARRREHDRRRRGAGHDVHRALRRHRRDQRPARAPQAREGDRRAAARRRRQRRLRLAVPLPALGVGLPARAGALDQRLGPQVRPRLPRDRLAGVPGEAATCAEDLVFYENYLGKTDATFTLNFSTGSAMVLAQYYNFVRFGHGGYRYIMETMQANTRALAQRIAEIGAFRLIGDEDEEQLPLVAFQLAEEHDYDEFDVASQLAAERGWMVPAYTLPPNADHVKIMRALVKLTLGHSLVTTLADDIAQACETLEQKGGLHELDRQRVKSGTGY